MAEERDILSRRLVEILKKFNSGDNFTARELADEFGVSIRTIQRDISQRLSFLPIEKNGTRYILADYTLGQLSYSHIKQFATFSGLQSLYPELNDKFIVDILNKKTSSSIDVKGYKYEDLSHKIELFNTIATAIIKYQKVTFRYKNRKREVEPYKLANIGGVWYLIGLERGIIKHFAFNKLVGFQTSLISFQPDIKIVDEIEQNRGNWATQNHIEVTLSVDNSVSHYFLARDILPCQKILEKQSDRLIISSTIAYKEEILRAIRYWIPHIHILKPSSLQDRLNSELEEYLSKQNI